MRRRILATAVAATGILALSACSGGGGGASGMDAQGPITIWYSNNAAEIAWGQQMVDAWNADHPDEQITAQEIPAGSSSEEVIGAAITAGNAPCLVFNTSPAAVPGFQRQGGLVNLSEFPDGEQYITERSGELVVGRQLRVLGVEPGLGEEVLVVEDHHGVALPRQLVEAAVIGAVLVGAATFDDANGEAVADFWRTIYSEQLAGNEQYQGDAFADGQAAMAIVGPWAVSVYQDKVNWGAVPVPTEKGTAADETWTFSDAKNVGLFTACENKGTAWDVLKFATSEEQDGTWLQETGQMPLRQNLTDTYADYFAANPAYEQFGDQAARTVEVPNVANSVEIWQTFRDGYSKAVIFGEGDVSTFLSDAKTQIDQLAAGK